MISQCEWWERGQEWEGDLARQRNRSAPYSFLPTACCGHSGEQVASAVSPESTTAQAACMLLADGFWRPTLFPRRYRGVLFGVAAATKTIVGVFTQQLERLSSVAEEGGKVKWSPGMDTMSMTPYALQRPMAAVHLKKRLKPLVILAASFGCSSGFQLCTSWVLLMLECGLTSPVVGPGAGHGWQGLPSNASCSGSLTALYEPSLLFLLHAVCLPLVLSTQLTSLTPKRQLRPGDYSFWWSLGKQSQVLQGTETQPLQAG